MVNPNGVQLTGTLVQVRALTERECLRALVSECTSLIYTSHWLSFI